ncbi:hypothetical protein P691DRAFT_453506 [Macrolepiota fuliginosa MF-IS2]|uniref:C2H2-type domain-containing protein n=1 Tax=Macrolepiota fuliginosa MF-IS2 TaxID=1400762 RepID=A0A9P5X2K0_9AGAR|nr:hypothetical protein P691DRAFT_453506 [Macrolepiota fuliginosa MF-IS2]
MFPRVNARCLGSEVALLLSHIHTRATSTRGKSVYVETGCHSIQPVTTVLLPLRKPYYVRMSSNPHPFCLACDRRLSSELACNARTPTFDCLKCGKHYSSQFALDGRYRGHTDHPNCPVCGKGFYDNAALTAHISDTHNDLWCSTYNPRFKSVATANEHYTTSPVHPKCGHCGVGFRDGDVFEEVRSCVLFDALKLILCLTYAFA